MVSGRRGYVWALNKSGVLRDSAQDRLQTSAGIHMKKCSHTHKHVSLCYVNTFTFIYTNYETARCICQQRPMPKKTLLQRNTLQCLGTLKFPKLIEEHALMASSVSSWRSLISLLCTRNAQFLLACYTCPLQRACSGTSPSPPAKKERTNSC
jgi:hypothetical protein